MPGTDPDQHISDATLVERCLERQPGAWEELVRRYAGLVYSIPRGLGLSQPEAEDVSQSVFTSLLSAMPAMRDRQTLAKWLITVANRQAWRTIRARRNAAHSTTLDHSDLASHPADEAPDIAAWERRQLVRAGLSLLGDRCQELLTALFSDRATPDYQEIGLRLGMPVGSIGPTRNRCLRKLMEALAAQPGADLLLSDHERTFLQSGSADQVSGPEGAHT